MHELSICTALLARVLDVAAAEGGKQVSNITLCIGPLSGVEPDQLRLAFPIVARGTPCEGAEINIECAPVQVHCKTCGETSVARPNRLLCAACGAWRVSLISGDEMRLLRIELPDAACANTELSHV